MYINFIMHYVIIVFISHNVIKRLYSLLYLWSNSLYIIVIKKFCSLILGVAWYGCKKNNVFGFKLFDAYFMIYSVCSLFWYLESNCAMKSIYQNMHLTLLRDKFWIKKISIDMNKLSYTIVLLTHRHVNSNCLSILLWVSG